MNAWRCAGSNVAIRLCITVAEYWIGLESQSDHSSDGEEGNILHFCSTNLRR